MIRQVALLSLSALGTLLCWTWPMPAQAFPPNCYQLSLIYLDPDCTGCEAILCDPCASGTCPGNQRICNLQNDFERRPGAGFSILSLGEVPCFTLYACKPTSAGSCNETNVCTFDPNNKQESSTTFSKQSGGGVCP